MCVCERERLWLGACVRWVVVGTDGFVVMITIDFDWLLLVDIISDWLCNRTWIYS